MTPRKSSKREEPFLNAVARKLGHAAGTLTNVAQGLTGNLANLSQAISVEVRASAGPQSAGAHSEGQPSGTRKTRGKKARSAPRAKSLPRKPPTAKSRGGAKAAWRGKKA